MKAKGGEVLSEVAIKAGDIARIRLQDTMMLDEGDEEAKKALKEQEKLAKEQAK